MLLIPEAMTKKVNAFMQKNKYSDLHIDKYIHCQMLWINVMFREVAGNSEQLYFILKVVFYFEIPV